MMMFIRSCPCCPHSLGTYAILPAALLSLPEGFLQLNTTHTLVPRQAVRIILTQWS